MSDFHFANHGTICVLTPKTEAARDWTDEHIPEDAQWWGGGVVIEPRYVQPILDGIEEDGLEVGA